MVDLKLLIETINDSGLKMKYVAQGLGITYYGLLKKLKGESEFKASEISKLSLLLGMDTEKRDEIFFAPFVESKSTKEVI